MQQTRCTSLVCIRLFLTVAHQQRFSESSEPKMLGLFLHQSLNLSLNYAYFTPTAPNVRLRRANNEFTGKFALLSHVSGDTKCFINSYR